MTDIEKEMYHKVVSNISNGTSKEFKAVASACYEIHRREMINTLEEILGKFKTQEQVVNSLQEKLEELKG
jgi:hypothetical protein